jgi:L-ascorbate metabolism protein UlaG (beta-lactamase superfamily)
MRLTKFEHACVVLEKSDARLIIDPGSFTLPLTDILGVVGVVVTHEHADHWTADHLTRILDRNPDARILGPAGVAVAAAAFPVEVVAAGDTVTVGPFALEFFGKTHAVIHESIPIIDNVGVLVDGSFYYGGDSYTLPGVPVETLAVPVGAPWLKIGDVMDYVLAVSPRRSIPVHDIVLSQIGRGMTHPRVEAATKLSGGEFFALEPGETLEL